MIWLLIVLLGGGDAIDPTIPPVITANVSGRDRRRRLP